jgi:hypothetical protein
MSTTIHIPALRLGKPYKSVDQLTTTGATVSQVNSGLIRRDLLGISKATEELQAILQRGRRAVPQGHRARR